MEYIILNFPLLTLILDFESIRLASLINVGMEYMDITVVLAAALLVTVVLDQLALIRGKFDNRNAAVTVESTFGQENTFKQFLKYQFFYGTKREDDCLMVGSKINHIQFFVYNLFASSILFTVLVLSGSLIRILWVNLVGNFGPIELELIAGILVTYFIFLGLMFSKKKKSNSEKTS